MSYIDSEFSGDSVQLATSISILITDWIDDTTYFNLGYTKKAPITVVGMTVTMVPRINYSSAAAALKLFSPFGVSFTNGLYIWAKTTPSDTIIIDSIDGIENGANLIPNEVLPDWSIGLIRIAISNGGTESAYTATIENFNLSEDKIGIRIVPIVDCAASATLSINGTAALPIYNTEGVVIEAGQIKAGVPTDLIYYNSRFYFKSGGGGIKYPLNIDNYNEKIEIISNNEINFSSVGIIEKLVTEDITFTLINITVPENYCKTGVLIIDTQAIVPSITFPSDIEWTADFSLGAWTTNEIALRKYPNVTKWIGSLINTYTNYHADKFNLNQLEIGSVINIWNSNLSALLPWIVCAKDMHATGGITLISQYTIDQVSYNNPAVSNGSYWGSNLDTYLENTFINYFPNSVDNALISVPLKVLSGDIEDTSRKIFAPTSVEVGLASNAYTSAGSAMSGFITKAYAYDNPATAKAYLLRSNGYSTNTYNVNTSGNLAAIAQTSTVAMIRPCIVLPSTFQISPPINNQYIINA